MQTNKGSIELMRDRLLERAKEEGIVKITKKKDGSIRYTIPTLVATTRIDSIEGNLQFATKKDYERFLIIVEKITDI